MTDVALSPGPAFGDGISQVSVSGDGYGAGIRVGVWTVPAGVFSFTVFIHGAAGGTGWFSGNYQGAWGSGLFTGVPCTPGEVWALEAGNPPKEPGHLSAGDNTYQAANGGGPYFYPGFGPDDVGTGGGGASYLARRPTPSSATWEVWMIAGGGGGSYNPGSTGNPWVYSSPGPVSFGLPLGWGPPSQPAQGPLRAGGAGAGYPSGTSGGAAQTAGGTGGSYFPASFDLGGPASPSWEEATGLPTTNGGSGGVVVFWYDEEPDIEGWHHGLVRGGTAAWSIWQ